MVGRESCWGRARSQNRETAAQFVRPCKAKGFHAVNKPEGGLAADWPCRNTVQCSGGRKHPPVLPFRRSAFGGDDAADLPADDVLDEIGQIGVEPFADHRPHDRLGLGCLMVGERGAQPLQ